MTEQIVTPRLIMRPPVYDDVPLMVRWLNDPQVVKYSEQRHKVHTTDTQRRYLNSIGWPSEYRVICLKERPIGTILATIDPINSVADLGILIGEKEEWSKGYGLEAWRAVTAHLFDYGIRKIEAGCMDENKPMVKLCIKSYMDFEGSRKKHFLLNKIQTNMLLWGKYCDG